MIQEAPIDYVETYYETRLKRRRDFPEARRFYEAQLKHVSGDRVINLGCGPQFYDDLRHFATLPRYYSGLDLNQQNLEYLKSSQHKDLEAGRNWARDNDVKVDLVCGDILEESTDFGAGFEKVDCAVCIGFLGIFSEEPFKKAVGRIREWLVPGGRLVNLSWCHNLQEKTVYEGRLKYGFNRPNNPGHHDIIKWTTESDFILINETVFDVPHKEIYGWKLISSAVFELAD
ncbi:MAG: class I SAM-dependent methyltransferase [Pseudomonadota bacterium]